VKTIEHITEIDAPAEIVWAILMDVERYAEWNPFLRLGTVPTHVGQELSVTVRAGKRSMTFTPTLTTFEPGRSIGWLGKLFVPRLFDGAHELHVDPIDDRRTRFTHRESFRGLLVPFLRSALRETDAGFAAMNAALAQRASDRSRADSTGYVSSR
jgi:hypothetical protein